MRFHELDRSGVQREGRSAGEFADDEQSALALDQAHDAVLASRAHHGVDFPMAKLGAIGGCGRAL